MLKLKTFTESFGIYSYPQKSQLLFAEFHGILFPIFLISGIEDSFPMIDVPAATPTLKIVATYFVNVLYQLGVHERFYWAVSSILLRVVDDMVFQEPTSSWTENLDRNRLRIQIQFDAVFNNTNFQSASGLVVWSLRGENWLFTIMFRLHL